jgi:circadian clock protein KaiB
MTKSRRKPTSRTKEFEEAVSGLGQECYELKLYVAGSTRLSVKAIATLKKICEEHLKGRYTLEVIDIYQQPTLARREQIIAAPTLVRKLPLPLRKFIGDMSDPGSILMRLDIREKKRARPCSENEAVPG